MTPKPELWSGRIGFTLAAIGSAVGLGSIWKFPYEVGTNGGSAFVLFYLLGLALVVFPLMLVEFAIGRRGRADASQSIANVAAAARASPAWALVGAMGVVTAFLILSFYSVIGGWAIAYLAAASGLGAEPQAVKQQFDALLASPLQMALYHAAFMLAAGVIVARGIVGGIEIACKMLMPILALLMLVLATYAMSAGDVAATVRFLFALDLQNTTPKAALEALGLGFFSIGVGLAVMVTYAAHADSKIDLVHAAIASIVADTAISFLAGFAVFPVVFAHGLDPSSGPGLMFVSLPIAFGGLPFGRLAAAAFFALLVVAALASAISLLEMPVAFLRHRMRLGRPAATLLSGASCWTLGLATVLSFNVWADWFPLAAIPGFATATVFDLLDHLTSNLLLPIGGFALAVFAGWVIPIEVLAHELSLGAPTTRLLRPLLRYVVPLAIAAVTISPLLA